MKNKRKLNEVTNDYLVVTVSPFTVNSCRRTTGFSYERRKLFKFSYRKSCGRLYRRHDAL